MTDLDVTVVLEPQIIEVTVAPFVALPGGGGAVDSVNGLTGTVVLDATAVGADPAGAAAGAIATASTDAATKASTAQAAAIAAAAADATAKVTAEATARATAITTAVAALIAGAPGALDTLLEISQQLATDESAVAALVTTVSGKASTTALNAEISRAQAAEALLESITHAAATYATLTALATTNGNVTTVSNAIAAEVTRALAAEGLAIPLTQRGAANGVATLDGSTTIPDAQIPATITRDSEMTAAIAAAVSNLVNGAPGILDTLGEIAAQLATDESAVGALTTAVAGKQPIDSDLTTIAALDSTVAGALVTDGGGWIRKTYAQLKTALALVKGDVGLGSVDNTSDAAKPVSTAQQAALDLKAPLASPTLTGTPTAPTAAPGTSTTQVATTAFTAAAVAALVNSAPGTLDTLGELATALAADESTAATLAALVGTKAPLASPALTGTPTAPTAAAGTSTTQIASTAFVAAAAALRANALTITAVKTANYTAAPNEVVRFDSTLATRVLTLPAAPADKTLVGGKMVLQGGTFGVTINCSGSDTINRTAGVTTLNLTLLGEGLLLEYTASDSTWTVVGRDIALSQLDLRYPQLSIATTKGDLLVATAAGVLARLGVGADTTVLTADATQPGGVKWAAPAAGAGGAGAPGARSGSYYSPLVSTSGAMATATHALNTLWLVPILLAAGTLDRIAVNLNTGATAGEFARLGIYSDSSGYPGALLLDAGQVSLAATGIKAITISQAVSAGVYWLAFVRQGSVTTPQCVTYTLNNASMAMAASLPDEAATLFGSPRVALQQTGVTGALPTPFTSTVTLGPAAGTPLIAVRYA